MQKSCLRHPEYEPLLIIRQSNLTLCDGNHCAAALLSYFEYWHNVKLRQQEQATHYNRVATNHGDPPTQDTSLLQFHTEQALVDGLLGLYGKNSVRDAIALLTAKNFLSIHANPNPRYKFDKTRYFLLHVDVIAEKLDEIYAPQSSNSDCVKNGSSSSEMEARCSEMEARCSEMEAAITESSSQDFFRDKKQENPPFPPSGTDVPCVCSPGAYVAETALQPYEYRGKVEPLPVDTLDMHSSRKPAYPPGFLAFWEAYPKKRRVGKPKCLVLWTKRGLEHRQEAVLAELQRMKNTADWQQGFMPASTTWLNQGRYDDGDTPAFTSHAEDLFSHVRQHRDPNADPLLAALYQRNQTHKLSTLEEPRHV